LAVQGYEFLQTKNEVELTTNLRAQIEKLNNYLFSDKEWTHFFAEIWPPVDGFQTPLAFGKPRLLAEAEFTVGTPFGYRFGEFQPESHDFGYASVAVHCHVAEQVAGFVIKSQLLPSVDQRTVMKINAQTILVGINRAHIKRLYHQFA
jgi:hypothetical protein